MYVAVKERSILNCSAEDRFPLSDRKVLIVLSV